MVHILMLPEHEADLGMTGIATQARGSARQRGGPVFPQPLISAHGGVVPSGQSAVDVSMHYRYS